MSKLTEAEKATTPVEALAALGRLAESPMPVQPAVLAKIHEVLAQHFVATAPTDTKRGKRNG